MIVRIVGALLVFAGLTLLPQAKAGVISGVQYTAGGKAVDLQGLEWLSLDRTRGYSRLQVEGGQDGLVSDGWRYATRNEASLLLRSLWGGVQGGSWDNGDGADWLFTYLGGGNLFAGHNELHSFFFGGAGECSPAVSTSCRGMYGVSYSNVGNPPTGWFLDEYGLSATGAATTIDSAEMNLAFGSLLVRDIQAVPEPTSIALVVVSLMAVGMRRTFRMNGRAPRNL